MRSSSPLLAILGVAIAVAIGIVLWLGAPTTSAPGSGGLTTTTDETADATPLGAIEIGDERTAPLTARTDVQTDGPPQPEHGDVAQTTWTIRGSLYPAAGAPLDGARIGLWQGKPTDRTQILRGLMGGAPSAADAFLKLKGEPFATAMVDASTSMFEIEVPAETTDVRLSLLHRYHGLLSPIAVHRKTAEQRIVDVGRIETYAGGHVVGRILGVDPGQLADNRVQLSGEPDPMMVLTDPSGFIASVVKLASNRVDVAPDGSFEFLAVPPVGSAIVSWSSDLQRAREGDVPVVLGQTCEVVLVAVPAASVDVTVVDPDGAPVEDAEVVVEPYDARGNIERIAARHDEDTDAEGNASFRGLDAGRHIVQTSAPGWRGTRQEFEIAEGETKAITLTLEVGAACAGRVVDEDGNPIEGAKVAGLGSKTYPVIGDITKVAGAENLEKLATQSPFSTDADGRFVLSGLPEGEITIVAAHEGYAATLATGTAVPIEPGIEPDSAGAVEVTLRKPTRIRGRVVVEDSEEPIPEFDLQINATVLFVIDRAVINESVHDDDGHFAIDDVPPGKYELTIRSEQHGTKSVAIELQPGVDQDLGTIVMPSPANVSGTVLDPDGNPVAGAIVFPRRGGMLDDPILARLFGKMEPVKTGLDGSFEVQGLSANRGVVLRAAAPGWAPGQSSRIELFAGRTVRGVEIQLERGGDITGRLLLPEGREPTQWKVIAMRKPFGGSTSTMPAIDGTFTLRALEPGDWQVQAMDLHAMQDIQQRMTRDTLPGEIPDMSHVMETVSEMSVTERARVRSGEATEVELDARELDISTGARLEVAVRVGNRPLENGIAELTGSNGNIDVGFVQAGSFSVKNLEPGSYTVVLQGWPNLAVIGSPTILEIPESAKGSTHRAEITLSGGSIAGKVLDESGAPMSAVYVRLYTEPGKGGPQGAELPPVFAISNKDGTFRFDGLAAGTYALRADTITRNNDAAKLDKIQLMNGQSIDDLELVAGTGAILDVAVFDTEGRPARRAVVSAVDGNGQPIASLPACFTDSEGRARIAGLPDVAECWVIVRSANSAPSVDGPFALVSGGITQQRQIRLARGIPVQIQALDARGRDLSRTGLRVRIDDGPWIPESLLQIRYDGPTVDLGPLPAGHMVTFAIGGPSGDVQFESRRQIPSSGRARYVLTP